MTGASEVIAHYDRLLERTHLAGTQDLLARAMEESRLTFQGRPICSTLRPHIVERATYGRYQEAARAVGTALEIANERLIQDSALRQQLCFPAFTDALIAIDGHQKGSAMVGRLDSFVADDGELRFIEHNPQPFGIIFSEMLASIFARLPIMEEMQKTFTLTPIRMMDVYFESLQKGLLRPRDGAGPSIALLTAGGFDLNLLGAEVPTYISLLESRGGRVTFATAAEFALDNGVLTARGEPVDYVYLLQEPKDIGPGHPVLVALQQNVVRVFNGMSHGFLTSSKAVFELLSDPEHAGMFDTKTVASLARHIPWTRIVRERKTTFHGETIDLIPFITARRESLVIKPIDGFGGEGIIMGWLHDDAAWSAAIANALSGRPHVVQERVVSSPRRFPVAVDGKLVYDERHVDLNPYVWRGTHPEGMLVRLSTSSLLNFTLGGATMIPTFIVD
jgi:hypothetical protein